MLVSVEAIKQALVDSEGTQTWEEILDDSRIFDGVYLFFSFDLVNSTIFKSQYSERWQTVFTRFYELVSSKLTMHYNNISIWKYIGDEVLLYLKVNDIEEVYNAPINSLKIIEEVTETLYTNVEETRDSLFIKATLWIAKVNLLEQANPKKHQTNAYKNIAFASGDLPDWLDLQRIDFLGPDIDLGFRLSQYTQKQQLLISAEIAFILNRKNGEVSRYGRDEEYRYRPNECCKIISLKKLKGIWNGRGYPIIWFNRNWNIDTIFPYDEHLNSELVDAIKNNRVQTLDDNIEKIFIDLKKIDEIEEIIKLIEVPNNPPIQQKTKYRISNDRLAEVHCAAICFNREGKILIAKRPQNKSRLQGVWEFGCGQLEINQDISSCIRLNYKKDFDANLNFLLQQPIPVTTYSFQIAEEARIVPGILFFAMIDNPSDVETNFNRIKHSDIKWIEKSDLETLSEDEYVENFIPSARLAFETFERYKHML